MPTTRMASAAGAGQPPRLMSASAEAATAYMTVSERTPPTRSASAPPSGRTSEPANTQAAVK